EAGFLYLAATHLATLTLFAHFSLLGVAAGSLAFPAAGSLVQQETITAALFITALIGFGIKAGIMPLHVWLPTAHASAPSHISAMMSGLLIKSGIYGIFRFISFFHEVPAWWGVTLIATGAISALTGVVFALAQHDLKRLLAYHSIENIGIIFMGLGTGVIGLSLGNLTLMVLGTGGALLHTLNHALFKGLLFLSAGSVIHATGSRQIDRLGGLGRQMPLTAFFFLLGAVAISGLPPLNGFISELLIYLGLFSGLQGNGTTSLSAMALSIPILAMVGGLAITCFIKVHGVVFLGHPRYNSHGEDPTFPMLMAMTLLALPCLMIGVLPQPVVALLGPAIANVVPVTADQIREAITPLGQLLIPTVIFVALGITIFILFRLSSPRKRETEETWSCGYLTPTPRMQYTASSFAATLVDIFRSILRPHQRHPHLAPFFPDRQRHRSHQPETVLDYLFMPLLRVIEQQSSWLRRLQHGQLHLYILYIFATVLILLAWSHG
ncbi:MAG TPA: proton-conducting transporter membrane subunit, partial [Geobacterales bacterium]|nr:proton-conducting transporter membrane subunit [Geobacterales bacterium]